MLITKEQRQQSIEKSLEKCYQPPRNKNETQFKLAHPTKPVKAQKKLLTHKTHEITKIDQKKIPKPQNLAQSWKIRIHLKNCIMSLEEMDILLGFSIQKVWNCLRVNVFVWYTTNDMDNLSRLSLQSFLWLIFTIRVHSTHSSEANKCQIFNPSFLFIR